MLFPLFFSVPTLLETRREQAADHAPTAKAIQEPNHPGLQDSRSGIYRHGGGTHCSHVLVYLWFNEGYGTEYVENNKLVLLLISFALYVVF